MLIAHYLEFFLHSQKDLGPSDFVALLILSSSLSNKMSESTSYSKNPNKITTLVWIEGSSSIIPAQENPKPDA